MRIGDLTSYTNAINAAGVTNSDMIINYAPNDSTDPVTYKVSLLDNGKALANALSLVGYGANKTLTLFAIDTNAYVSETLGQYIDTTDRSVLDSAVTGVTYDGTNKKFTKTVFGTTTTDIVTAATLKSDMALDNVENKSSATIRSELTSTNVTTALGYTPLDSALKGANSGLAELDASGKVPSTQLPSYVDDVVEGYYYNNNFYKEAAHTTAITGEADKIYVDLSGGRQVYRWSGSAFVEIPIGLALGETEITAYRGDYGAAAYAHAVTNKGVSAASGLYKITTNSEGHVTAATAVEKSDITALGIPESDTTYSTGTDSVAGLTKLYTGYGANTDGAVTQSSLTTLIANIISDFGLTVALPSGSSITEDTANGVLVATITGTTNNCTTIIQKQSGSSWNTYNEGDSWSANDVFRVYVTRTITIGSTTYTNSGVIGNTYTAVDSWVPSHTLTINYEYEDHTEAETTYSTTVGEGLTYSVASPEITGYTPDVATVSGTMGDSDVTVTVTYTEDTPAEEPSEPEPEPNPEEPGE